MTNLPIICDTCGDLSFATSPIRGGGGSKLEITGDFIFRKSCRNCGGDCHVIQGLYKLLDNAVEFLVNSKTKVTDLQKLVEILQKAQKSRATSEETEEKIKEELPHLSGLAKYLPKDRNEAYQVVQILATLIK